MRTLEKYLDTRVSAFLDESGMSRTTLGMKAVGDPNLLREIERGRSVTLRMADRILAFIRDPEGAGGARAPPRARRRRARSPQPEKRRRSRVSTERATEPGADPPIRFLRLAEVQARTGLSRATIYVWMAEGRFPRAIQLGPRSVGWIEAEIDEWMRERIAKSRGEGEPVARTG